MREFLNRIWYDKGIAYYPLIPLAMLYRGIFCLRKWMLAAAGFPRYLPDIPVVVVGNVAVGGTGKTPLTVAIVEYLQQLGYRPGVVSRGYGGKATVYPKTVLASDYPEATGDEPLLIKRRLDCPVVVDPKRPAALERLVSEFGCDVVVSDDGLQHFPLKRDIEIVVVDGVRKFGNGWCLPAGPLREPASRIKTVDFVVYNGGNDAQGYTMTLKASRFVSLNPEETGQEPKLADQPPAETVHAVAGIGNPERFFKSLEMLGLKVIRHPFPDHHPFTRKDLTFSDGWPVVMTEKDAVKCRDIAPENSWYLEVEGIISNNFLSDLEERLRVLRPAYR